MIDRNELIQMLKEAVITVNSTKTDGTFRRMVCTLRDDILPEQTDVEEHIQRKVNTETLVVWDIEADGWRSFRIDSIIDINGRVYE